MCKLRINGYICMMACVDYLRIEYGKRDKRAIPGWRLVEQWLIIWLVSLLTSGKAAKVPLPNFRDMVTQYPGYFHHGGQYRNHELLNLIGITGTSNLLIHDTSALRISYTFNQIGGAHSLGTELIRLSKYGHDSVQGHDNLQYMFLPIAFGPYLADKYGYPNISKMHALDPVETKHYFWGKQGILRVITYTRKLNLPKGHVALWDCDHFHQSKDWIANNTLITVEFWESPDSNCTVTRELVHIPLIPPSPLPADNSAPVFNHQSQSERTKFIKTHLLPKNARHQLKKQRDHGNQ